MGFCQMTFLSYCHSDKFSYRILPILKSCDKLFKCCSKLASDNTNYNFKKYYPTYIGL